MGRTQAVRDIGKAILMQGAGADGEDGDRQQGGKRRIGPEGIHHRQEGGGRQRNHQPCGRKGAGGAHEAAVEADEMPFRHGKAAEEGDRARQIVREIPQPHEFLPAGVSSRRIAFP